MDEKYHSAVAAEELNNRTEVNIGEWYGVEPSATIRNIVHVVQGRETP